MDLHMPVMDGFGAIKRIRELEVRANAALPKTQQRRLPVIAATADALQADRARCVAAGFDDYLSKPFGLESVKALVTHWTGYVASHTPAVPAPVAPLSASAQRERDAPMLDGQQLRNIAEAGGDRGAEVASRIAQIFLTNTPLQIERIRAAAESLDRGALQQAGHAIKGAAANVGAMKLMYAARAIETAAKSSEPADLRALVAKLDRTFGATEHELAQFLDGMGARKPAVVANAAPKA
jgi:CheY-like chemotaxis protein